MLTKEQLSQEAEKLSNDVRIHPCFLFIGNSVNDAMLTDTITSLPWAGIISTSENPDVIHRFNVPGRTIRNIQAIPEIQPNRKNMPFISLANVIKINHDDTEEDRLDDFKEQMKEILLRLMQETNHLYVIGYTEKEFGIRCFERNICKNAIMFFGWQEDNYSKLAQRRKENHEFRFYEETLDCFFSEMPEDDDFEDIPSDDSLYFFANGKLQAIPRHELLRTHSFITLVNRFDTEYLVPHGQAMQQRYFIKFLEASSGAPPQWYAYSPYTSFAVRRTFEDGLQSITKAALNGDAMPDGKPYDPKKPIVLTGPPSSSKTVALEALAYHIFCQEIYPVLFIRGDIQKITTGEYKDDLIELMQKINQIDPDSKILLICDCSSHQNTFTYAKSMASALNNIGRRFVLVLSSYEHDENRGEKQNDYIWANGRFEKVHPSKHPEQDASLPGIQSTDRYWIVNSSRLLDRREKEDIQALFTKFGGLDLPSDWWSEVFDADKDIFEYFYYLTDVVRDPMIAGLKNERFLFRNYFDNRLREIYQAKRLGSGNTLGELFPELFEAATPDKANEYDYPQEAFEKFQTCIALLSQYAIDVPHSLAISMFNHHIDTSVYYSTDEFERSLNRFLTQSIPWICYQEIDGSFFFSFRNPREAILYLDDRFSGKTQSSDYLDAVLSLLDHYCQHFSCSDAGVVNALTEFLHEIGPNARSWNSYNGNNAFIPYIIQNLDKLIAKMEQIIYRGLDSEYKLMLCTITFRREHYCQHLYSNAESDPVKRKNTLETVLHALRDTVLLCDTTLDHLDEQQYYNQNLKAQIINEKAQCNIRAIDVLENYLELCQQHQLEPLPALSRLQFLSAFEEMFTLLESVIYSYPTNGFYYNSLFRLFGKWNRNPDEKLPYYGRMTMIVDLRNAHEVINTGGNDELGHNIARFHQSLCKDLGNITIDHIRDEADPAITDFCQKFNEALAKGDSSYIWLVCYNELTQCGIINDKKQHHSSYTPNSSQIAACKKVFVFMEEYYSVVKNNPSSLQLMLRVYWLATAGSEPMVIQSLENECRFTHFNAEQWHQINAITSDYCKLCDEQKRPSQPFMRYIYALSVLYISPNQDGFNECRRLLRDQHEHGFISGERRMYSPFVLCNENGKPIEISGSVISVKNEKNGAMSVRIPNAATIEASVHCTNIGLPQMPEVEIGKTAPEVMDGLVLGISYTRFQVYSKAVVDMKEKRRNYHA